MPEMIWQPLADDEVGPAWHDHDVHIGSFPGSMGYVLLGKKLQKTGEVRWITVGRLKSDVGPCEMPLETARAEVSQVCKKLGLFV